MPINPTDFFNMGVQASQRFGGLQKGLDEANNLTPSLLTYQLGREKIGAAQGIAAQKNATTQSVANTRNAVLQENTNQRVAAVKESTSQRKASDAEKLTQDKTKLQAEQIQKDKDNHLKIVDDLVKIIADKDQTVANQVKAHAMEKNKLQGSTGFGGVLGIGKKAQEPSFQQLLASYQEMSGMTGPTPLGGSVTGTSGNAPQQILVIKKSTGQKLSIPADKFDPNVYEMV